MFSTPLAVLTDATQMPTPTSTVPAESVTPGPIGFTVMALLVVVVFLIVWDMQRRIRRTRYRAEVNEELDRQEAEAAAAAAAQTDVAADAAETEDEQGDAASAGPNGSPRG